jgi:hypothetical protein
MQLGYFVEPSRFALVAKIAIELREQRNAGAYNHFSLVL